MRLRYAGVDLLIEEPDGPVKAFLDDHLPNLWERLFPAEPVWSREHRTRALCTCGGFVGLPQLNHVRETRPQLNTLYWPSGAARWASGLFFVTAEQYDTILDEVLDGEAGEVRRNVPAAFEFGPEDVITKTTELYALHPYPLTRRELTDDKSQQLLLLPLVDVRYYWQWKHVGELFAPVSWSDAFEKCRLSLDVTTLTADSVSADLGYPSPSEFRRKFENAAMILDAVAASVGQRVYRELDGTVRSKYATATDRDQVIAALQSTSEKAWSSGGLLYGGEVAPEEGSTEPIRFTAPAVPSTVLVIYRDPDDETPGAAIQLDPVEILQDAGDIEERTHLAFTSDCTKIFRCAHPTDDDADDSFADKLAKKITLEWMRWQRLFYEGVFPGILDWTFSGWDDVTIWSFAVPGANGEPQCRTHVRSIVPFVGTESLPIGDEPIGDDNKGCCKLEEVHVVVTTKNVVLDGWGTHGIHVGHLTDADGKFYVEGQIIDRETGDVLDPDETIRIFPTRAMKGCLAYRTVVLAQPVAYNPEIITEDDPETEDVDESDPEYVYECRHEATMRMDAEAQLAISGATANAATLYPDDADAMVEDVPATAVCDLIVAGQRFVAEWHFKALPHPPAGGAHTELRVTDACCPP